ncbi:MAG TPA: metallophosphoesterase [Polyangiaceae bacterium]|nr:metallophosphoesterase [Polyangiaceae bacterium]
MPSSSATRMRSPRIVVIGDLNAAYDALVEILRGTKLVNRKLEWIGGRAELVQVGDLFNRGGGAAQALTLLLRLRRQARSSGGHVTVLLGNHEAMTALRHEGYCTEGEYLAFATAAERRAWPARIQRALRRLARQRPHGVVLPLEPRLEAWKIEHVPGRTALRRALGPRGKLGKALRSLPVAHISQGTLFVHAGLLPAWAKLGLAGLDEMARREWAAGSRGLWTLPKQGLFRSGSGPLWDRSLVRGGAEARRALTQSLALVGAERMIVGHTQTASLAGGREGHVHVQAGGRLVSVDVGLASGPNAPRAALILEAGSGYEWTPAETRALWKA